MLKRVITPAGRKDRLSILLEYIKRSYYNSEIDEWILFKNTTNLDDLVYIYYLSKEYDFIKIIELEEKYKGHMLDTCLYTWKRRLKDINTLKNRLLPILFLTIQSYSDPDVVYVKIDDDIVYIKDNSISKLISLCLSNSKYLFTYGNILNNSVIHHYHQLYKTINFKNYQHLNMHKSEFFNNPYLAIEIHNLLLTKLHNKVEESLFLPDIELASNVEFPINVMCWRGDMFREYLNKIKLLYLAHEEYYLSVTMCEDADKQKVICGETLFSHYSFSFQEKTLQDTDILHKYSEYMQGYLT